MSSVTHIDDAVIHTPSHRVHSLSSFDLTFSLYAGSQRIRLSLDPNHDILGDDSAVHYLDSDGNIETTEPIDRSSHRIFRGRAFLKDYDHSEWISTGWARIALHQDGPSPVFEGALGLGGDHYHVQTNANFRDTGVSGDPALHHWPDDYMVVWRDSDISGARLDPGFDELKRRDPGQEPPSSCLSDTLLFNQDEDHPVYRSLMARDNTTATPDSSLSSLNSRSLFGRQIDGTTGGNGPGTNLASTIGSTAGCPTSKKVALIGVATDCTYTGKFNSSQAMRENIIQQVNTASQLYESTFNISLGIQNLTISNANCPSTPAPQAPWNIDCSDSVTITDRLALFSKWRGQFNDTNAYWTLLTTCPTGSAVGLAWLGQLCAQGSQDEPGDSNQTTAGANVVVRTSTEWQVFAHESGHTFGAVHDCTDTTCGDGTVSKQQCCPLSKDTCDADGRFMMNPSTAPSISKFSPCSIGNICSAIQSSSVKMGCLTNNRNVKTITGSQCGNGIVEDGEDCDCGGSTGCGNNPCCDPKSCKFTADSVCDPSNEECCTDQCAFSSTGTVCRPSTGSCDPEETCTGKSGICPPDKAEANGKACGASGSGLTCASGQCTSRDQQCKVLMNSLTSGNITGSCPDGCKLSCSSTQFSSDTCVENQQYYIDGTPCEGGGQCNNGRCAGASAVNEVLDWIKRNKQIAIPVGIVVGLLLLIAIISCLVSAFRRCGRSRRRRRGASAAAAAAGRASKLESTPPPPPPPGWGDGFPGAYGPNGAPPPYPAAAAARGGASVPGPSEYYYPPPPATSHGPWRPQRTFSTRFA